MRLWSLHPQYLDPQGLVALWREALLAQAVLRGETRGYRHHPQLERFKSQADPQAALSLYLHAVHAQAEARGYSFDAGKIKPAGPAHALAVSSGQIAYEWAHLLAKLQQRNPALYQQWQGLQAPQPHPLFQLRPGPIEPWERP